MFLRKITAAVVILAFAVACMGCTGDDGGGKKGRSASRVSIGRKSGKQSTKKKGEEKALAEYTPEGSMKRDLTRMQQREQQQAKLIAQLRSSRNPDQERIEREEDKLYELRGRVQEYDAALQRYEMASRARPPREAGSDPLIVPEEMFRDRPVRNQTAYTDDYRSYARGAQASRGYAGMEGYRNDPVVYQDERMTHAKLPLGYDQGNQGGSYQPVSYQNDYIEERERVLYNPMADGSSPYSGRQILTEPGSIPPAAQNQAQYADRPAAGGTSFAGAPVGRSRHPAPAPRETSAPPPWESGPMYSDKTTSKTSVPDIYANRRQKEETLWPAGTAMVPPASSGNDSAQAKTTAVRLPENARKAPSTESGKPSGKKFPVADEPEDDEVFSPDMYLGN